MARCESHVIPESGHHVCDTAGTCKMVLESIVCVCVRVCMCVCVQ